MFHVLWMYSDEAYELLISTVSCFFSEFMMMILKKKKKTKKHTNKTETDLLANGVTMGVDKLSPHYRRLQAGQWPNFIPR